MAASIPTFGAASGAGRQPLGLGEIARTFAAALLIAFGVRAFGYEPFSIPTPSMTPTLLPGDYLFVEKWRYRLGVAPERGDVAVFASFADGRTAVVKRIAGLPGDRVRMRDGRLWLNGSAVPTYCAGRAGCIETLPGGGNHAMRDTTPFSAGDATAEFVVPAGHYFMLGDDRDGSADSRFPVAKGGLGFVPAKNLIGRAAVVFWPVDRIGGVR